MFGDSRAVCHSGGVGCGGGHRKIEAYRSEFEALYDELNALVDSRGTFIPGESVEEQIAALSGACCVYGRGGESMSSS